MTPFKYSDGGTWKVALVLRKHGIIHEFTNDAGNLFDPENVKDERALVFQINGGCRRRRRTTCETFFLQSASQRPRAAPAPRDTR